VSIFQLAWIENQIARFEFCETGNVNRVQCSRQRMIPQFKRHGTKFHLVSAPTTACCALTRWPRGDCSWQRLTITEPTTPHVRDTAT
jgi:hypothetical protein